MNGERKREVQVCDIFHKPNDSVLTENGSRCQLPSLPNPSGPPARYWPVATRHFPCDPPTRCGFGWIAAWSRSIRLLVGRSFGWADLRWLDCVPQTSECWSAFASGFAKSTASAPLTPIQENQFRQLDPSNFNHAALPCRTPADSTRLPLQSGPVGKGRNEPLFGRISCSRRRIINP